MKVVSIIMIASLVCCVILGPAAARGKANRSSSAKFVSALILQQKHIYLGKMKVILTPHAVKMECLGKFHFSLISKAPNWNVTVFRTDDRLHCTQTLDEFCDQGLFSNYVMNQKDRFQPSGGRHTNKKINGFVVQQTFWSNATFISLEKNGYAQPQEEAILHAAYKVPTNGQIPIKYAVLLSGKDWMTNLSEAGLHRDFLSTEKISREPVSTTEFELPSGLSQTKSVTRIVIGSSSKLKDTGADVLFNLGH